MKEQPLKSDALLLLTAVIWGTAFVAQRAGMEHVGPFTYNGIRFALGCLSLLPLLYLNGKKERSAPRACGRTLIWGGLLTGTALFAGASFQQAGMVHTTAGKAGFITGLYVVIVPILGLLWKQRPGAGTWAGALLAAVGLYLLSVTETFSISFGDLLILIGAFFWAAHVLIVGWLSPKIDPLKLAFAQFAACSALSLIAALLTETIAVESILAAGIPILYGGILSVGVAYTLQVVAQQNAHPAHTAVILSLEGVFAAIGGWMILGESLSARGFTGCALMLTGMLLSELSTYLFRPKAAQA